MIDLILWVTLCAAAVGSAGFALGRAFEQRRWHNKRLPQAKAGLSMPGPGRWGT